MLTGDGDGRIMLNEGLTEIASMIVVVFSLGGSAGCLARDDLPGWRSLVDVQQLD